MSNWLGNAQVNRLYMSVSPPAPIWRAMVVVACSGRGTNSAPSLAARYPRSWGYAGSQDRNGAPTLRNAKIEAAWSRSEERRVGKECRAWWWADAGETTVVKDGGV